MAPSLEFRLFFIIPMLLLGFCCPAASQAITTTPTVAAQSGSVSLSPIDSRSARFAQGMDGDFRKRVEARWNAARKGQIEVKVIPDTANHEIFTVHVVVTRAAAGSDGMTAVTQSKGDSWSALLKLDDEVAVRLSPEDVGSFEINPQESNPEALIRHLDPGGHAEWNWTVRRTRPGMSQLVIVADVVYRQNFSPEGKPVVSYESAKRLLSLP